MIMRKDNSGCVPLHGFPYNLARVNLNSIQCPNRVTNVADNAICGIEKNYMRGFAPQAGKALPQVIEQREMI